MASPSSPSDAREASPRGRGQRLGAVLDLVVDRGHVSVEEIVRTMGVSAATARRDLDELAGQQLVIRTRGGASLRPSSTELPLRYRAATAAAEKERIAALAVTLAEPGGVLAMNGGTTTTALAHELATHEAFAGSDRETVLVTNAINIAQELAVRRHLQLVVTGGVLRERSYELIGRWAESLLDQISIDTLFLGVNGIDAELGVCTHSDTEATMAARLVERSRRVVVIADAAKVGRGAFARICPAGRVDALVTDTGAEPAAVAALRDAGVEVLLA